jgi:hypothetical protein
MSSSHWLVRVTDLTDIYSETRVVDMLQTVDDVLVERVNDDDGNVQVSVDVPSRSVAHLVSSMVQLIDPHASVSHPRPRLLAGA